MNNKARATAARNAIRSSAAKAAIGTVAGTVMVSAEGNNAAPMFEALRNAGIAFDADGEGDYTTGEGDYVQAAYLR